MTDKSPSSIPASSSRSISGRLLLFFLANSRPALFAPLLAPFLPPELAGRRARRHLHRDRRVHPGGAARARGRLRVDAASAGHAARHRRRRRGVRRPHARAAERDLHQAQAHHHLPAVRRRAARRSRVPQAAARHGVRFGLPPDRRGLAQAHAALGVVLPRAGDAQRDRLAHAVDRFLGQLQGVRRAAADLRCSPRCNIRC